MAKFVRGDVVVVPFPFSDLSQSKRRPALVITSLDGDDLILCQITSQTIKDNYSLSLDDKDFKTGSLKQTSNLRPNRIFTADSHIILYRVGNLRDEKLSEVVEKIVEIIRGKNTTSDNKAQTAITQT
ncbi:MAG: growth inhibitor PemK [Nitrospirae bacterium CG_4_9_14_3_um_filter_53_35]|nr:MAG: growth inhibitor PemK [Nitrospirae bacterium CG2_30_53_67]PIS38267.1 MAG: growth inhibitor PemK [Nitrospirae bacterium CG08_land_8_20_14_0_20_52_24]PIV82263.1 MAG: growth inhibitor PemK [Nitrospirae bacterium CG17_big_fil_post_rev_8_21_14_2_50_50_9]PIW86045.1 MAG: growth inhibitor PemK [Nitrospirae bacterium CG_4_8_14_3_um_filter_50_41]PIX86232.1 MAG: growth inhibitor PemK [Nitrospirae bacterium CG_4_10_14_3_um_filter_53_41]PJA76246.1 MAG: growth inhibitor PemK [Nitrospirae bacterium C